ncbi:MAG: hypothetical protein ACPG05_03395 [Bdellovibrionales bacterium]
MVQHVVSQVASNIGVNLSATYKAETAPNVNNVGAHVGAVQESVAKLGAANEIRGAMQESLGNDAQPTVTSSNASMADALKSNVASGLVAAGLTAVGMPMVGIAVTAASTLSTMRMATQSTSNEGTYFKSTVEEEAEAEGAYTSYADSAVPTSSAETVQPQPAVQQPQMQLAIEDVVNRLGEDEVINQMGHLSQEEVQLMGQLHHHQKHLDTIASGQAAPAPAFT